jgi:TolA-binding protein
MRSLNKVFVLMAVSLALAALAPAQGTESASHAATPPASAAPESATKQEVNQLRSELAAQRQTIEELKALVEKLAGEKAGTADNGSLQIRPAAAMESSSQPPSFSAEGVRLRNAVLLEADPLPVAAAIDQAPATAPPKKDTPLAAGWNGEHFFIRSADGQLPSAPTAT